MASRITTATLKAHRATWWVYVFDNDGRRTRIRKEARMRGSWPGYDVTCSCGWESRTGGATRRSVEDELWLHRYNVQTTGKP
ncbi:hypothetical protein ABN028_19505 [Actinopolymorpha sp. B17G11]|uniref:hypothetical protein n=1 Tax=Actinopolymorpha sp. B17G11 TaxID=3160861 RepID=UPI0032E4E32D